MAQHRSSRSLAVPPEDVGCSGALGVDAPTSAGASLRRPLQSAPTVMSAPGRRGEQPVPGPPSAKHRTSAGDQRHDFVNAAARPPKPRHALKSVTSSSVKSQPQRKAASLQGNTLCFLSQSASKSSASESAHSQYTRSTASRKRGSSTASSQKLSDGTDVRTDAKSLTSYRRKATPSSTTSRSTGRYKNSVKAVDKKSVEPTQSTNSIAASKVKSTQIDVNVTNRQPCLRSAFATTVRSVIGAIFRGSDNRDRTVEDASPRCRSDDQVSLRSSRPTSECSLSPSSHPLPLPQPLPVIAATPKSEQAQVVTASAPSGKPSVQSFAPASVQQARPRLAFPVPSSSMKAGTAALSSKLGVEKIAPAECLEVPATSDKAHSPATIPASFEFIQSAKLQHVHNPNAVQLAVPISKEPSGAAPKKRSEGEPSVTTKAVTTDTSKPHGRNFQPQRTKAPSTSDAPVRFARVSHPSSTVAPGQPHDLAFPPEINSISAHTQTLVTNLLKSGGASSEEDTIPLQPHWQPFASANLVIVTAAAHHTTVNTATKSDVAGSLGSSFQVAQKDCTHLIQPPGNAPDVLSPEAGTVNVTPTPAPTKPHFSFASLTVEACTEALVPIAAVTLSIADSNEPSTEPPSTTAPSTVNPNVTSMLPQLPATTNTGITAAAGPISLGNVQKRKSSSASSKGLEVAATGLQQKRKIANKNIKQSSPMLVTAAQKSNRRLSENTLGHQTRDQKAKQAAAEISNDRATPGASGAPRRLPMPSEAASTPFKQGSGSRTPLTVPAGARLCMAEAAAAASLEEDSDSGTLSLIRRGFINEITAAETAAEPLKQKSTPLAIPEGARTLSKPAKVTSAPKKQKQKSHQDLQPSGGDAKAAPSTLQEPVLLFPAATSAGHAAQPVPSVASKSSSASRPNKEAPILQGPGGSQKDTKNPPAARDTAKQQLKEEHLAAAKAAQALQISNTGTQNQTQQSLPAHAISFTPFCWTITEAPTSSEPIVSEKSAEESQAAIEILKQLLDEEHSAATRAVHTLQISNLCAKNQTEKSSGIGLDSHAGHEILKQLLEEEHSATVRAVNALQISKLGVENQNEQFSVVGTDSHAGPEIIKQLLEEERAVAVKAVDALQKPKLVVENQTKQSSSVGPDSHAESEILKKLLEEHSVAVRAVNSLQRPKLVVENQTKQSSSVGPDSHAESEILKRLLEEHSVAVRAVNSLQKPKLVVENQNEQSSVVGTDSHAGPEIIKQLLEEEHAVAVNAVNALQKPKLVVKNQTKKSSSVGPLSARQSSEHPSEAPPSAGPECSEEHADESQRAADILKTLIEEEYAAAVKAAHSLQTSKLGGTNQAQQSPAAGPLSAEQHSVPLSEAGPSTGPGYSEQHVEDFQEAANILRELIYEEYAAAVKAAHALHGSNLYEQNQVQQSPEMGALSTVPVYGSMPEANPAPGTGIPANATEECRPEPHILEQLMKEEYAAAVKSELAHLLSQHGGPVQHQARDSASVDLLSTAPTSQHISSASIPAESMPQVSSSAAAGTSGTENDQTDHVLAQVMEQEYTAAVKAALALQVSRPSIAPKAEVSSLPGSDFSAKATEEYQTDADILKRFTEEESAIVGHARQVPKLPESMQYHIQKSVSMDTLSTVPPSGPSTSENTFAGHNVEISFPPGPDVLAKGAEQWRTADDHLGQRHDQYATMAERACTLQVSEHGESVFDPTRLAALPSRSAMQEEVGVIPSGTCVAPGNIVVEAARKILATAYDMLGLAVRPLHSSITATRDSQAERTASILAARREYSRTSEIPQFEQRADNVEGSILRAAPPLHYVTKATQGNQLVGEAENITAMHIGPTTEKTTEAEIMVPVRVDGTSAAAIDTPAYDVPAAHPTQMATTMPDREDETSGAAIATPAHDVLAAHPAQMAATMPDREDETSGAAIATPAHDVLAAHPAQMAATMPDKVDGTSAAAIATPVSGVTVTQPTQMAATAGPIPAVAKDNALETTEVEKFEQTVDAAFNPPQANLTRFVVPPAPQWNAAPQQHELTPRFARGALPGAFPMAPMRTVPPGQVPQQDIRVAFPRVRFPGAPLRWPALAPSAAAPTAAAPSLVVPTQRPTPTRMMGSFISMPPRMVPPLPMSRFAQPRMAIFGIPRTPQGATIGRMMAPRLSPPNMAASATPAHYAEMAWSRVALPSAPFSVAPSSEPIRQGAEEEPLHAGGEGTEQKLRKKKPPFEVRQAEDEEAKVVFEVTKTTKLANSSSRTGVTTRPRDMRQSANGTVPAEGPTAKRLLFKSAVKNLKETFGVLFHGPKPAYTPREVEPKSSFEDKSNTSTAHGHSDNEIRLPTPREGKSSKTIISPTQLLNSQCDTLETKSVHASDSPVQLKRAAEGDNERMLSPLAQDIKREPQPTIVQSSVVCVAQPAAETASDDVNACRNPAVRGMAQTLSAENLACRPLHAAKECDAQYGPVKYAAASRAHKFSSAIPRPAIAPVIASHERSILSGTANVPDHLRRPLSAGTAHRGSNSSPNLLERTRTSASREKKEEKREQRFKKRGAGAARDVVSPEMETPEETKTAARTADSQRTRVNREDLGVVRAEVVLSDDEPPWALLSCALFLVGAVLMSLLALIYALTTVVPPLEATQPAQFASPKSGIIYCSSEFCDREADYLGSLLGASVSGACENFYEYVCSAWSRAHPLSGFTGAGAAVSTDTIIQDTIDKNLFNLLGSRSAEDVGTAVALYNACADRDKADAATDHIKELFKAWKIRMWPRDTNSSVKEVWEFAGELVRDLGLSSIVDTALGLKARNNDSIVVELRQPAHVCNDAWRLPVKALFHNALSDLSLEFTHAPRPQIMDEVMNVFIMLGTCPATATLTDLNGDKFGRLPAAVIKLSDLHDDVRKFLGIVFEGVTGLGPGTLVVLKPASYIRDHITDAIRALPARALMNYMGLLALVHLSPFLPERHQHLRQLFGKMLRGRTLPDVSNSSVLCLMAVERALPACFSKLSASLFRAAEYDVRVPEKLSQLEDAFAHNLHHLAWISDQLAVVNRYRLKRRRASHFGPSAGGSAPCEPSVVARRTDSPVQFYRDVCRAQHRARLKPITSGRSLSAHQVCPVRPSSVHAVYDRLLRRVLVPAGLFNTSVPGNSTGFSLQLARYAVRFYHALLDALLLDDWDQGRNEVVQRKLQALLQCFEWDLRELPASLTGPAVADPVRSRVALLLQTASVQFAFRAFQDLWQVRRAWNADFRYRRLPSLSADALFFVYYALDNCETSDPVYKGDQLLPAEHRVNLPLRHLAEFAPLFNCSANTVMGRRGRSCSVVTPDTWSLRSPADA